MRRRRPSLAETHPEIVARVLAVVVFVAIAGVIDAVAKLTGH